MIFDYTPTGTCSRQMTFEIENDIIRKYTVTGGCPGNLTGIKHLIEGMNIHDVIQKFEGIRCGNKPTSCPDQIASALKQYIAENNR